MAFDPDAVKAKYLAERDRRLVPMRSAIRDLTQDEFFSSFRDDPFTPVTERAPSTEDVDVLIVGAGIAGILAGARIREAGIDRVRVVDKAGGIGGTWYWNQYPGVMCDVESYSYMPMLEEMGYIPSRRYAFGSEIRSHLQSIADKYGLTENTWFHTGVVSAEWDDGTARWRIETDRGDHVTCRWYVLATGILNLMKLPAIAGMESFAGRSFHSARWDYDYTGGGPHEPMTGLAGKKVALIGTGATAIQCLAGLADSAEHVYVFQRTPSAIGVRGNRETDPDFAANLKPGWRRDRMDNFQAIMLGKPVDTDLVGDGWTHHYAAVHHPPRTKDMTLADYLRAGEELDYRVMEEHRSRVATEVEDPATAEILKPYYRYLCKRPCFHDEYLPVFNRSNVTLVDCPSGVERVTERGPVVAGHQYDVDCIVYATGFEPEVTPLWRRAGHPVRGRNGVTIEEKWQSGQATLFGMTTRGFPNMFVMPAPAQQCVVTVNYTQLAELGAVFVGGAIAKLTAAGVDVFEASEAAESEWTAKVVSSFVDGSSVMSACTPSRINNEGHPELMSPHNANYGRGFGDWFGYRDRIEAWVEADGFDGFEVESR